MAETAINPDVEYIRKDVFEARMDRMEMLMEKTLMEMKADNEKLRSEVSAAVNGMKAGNEKLRSEVSAAVNGIKSEFKAEILDIRGDIRAINARIDGLQTGVYWGFTVLALLFGFVTFAPSIADFLRNLRRPSVTLEEVERVVDVALRRAKLQS